MSGESPDAATSGPNDVPAGEVDNLIAAGGEVANFLAEGLAYAREQQRLADEAAAKAKQTERRR